MALAAWITILTVVTAVPSPYCSAPRYFPVIHEVSTTPSGGAKAVCENGYGMHIVTLEPEALIAWSGWHWCVWFYDGQTRNGGPSGETIVAIGVYGGKVITAYTNVEDETYAGFVTFYAEDRFLNFSLPWVARTGISLSGSRAAYIIDEPQPMLRVTDVVDNRTLFSVPIGSVPLAPDSRVVGLEGSIVALAAPMGNGETMFDFFDLETEEIVARWAGEAGTSIAGFGGGIAYLRSPTIIGLDLATGKQVPVLQPSKPAVAYDGTRWVRFETNDPPCPATASKRLGSPSEIPSTTLALMIVMGAGILFVIRRWAS